MKTKPKKKRAKPEQYTAVVELYYRLIENDAVDKFLKELEDPNLLNSLECYEDEDEKGSYHTEFWIEERTYPKMLSQLKKVKKAMEQNEIGFEVDVFATYNYLALDLE